MKRVCMEIQTVRVSDIVRDTDLQVRSATSFKVAGQYARLMNNGADFPPIVLGQVGEALLLLDGWHRLEAACINGAATIIAEVKQMDRAEALRVAALSNLKHGARLKRGELREAFRLYIRGGGHIKGMRFKSYRIIGEELGGLPHTTIYNWMLKDFPKLARKMGAGGSHGNTEAAQPERDASGNASKQVAQAIVDARNLYEFVRCPEGRFGLIQQVESLLVHMRTAEHVQPEFSPDF